MITWDTLALYGSCAVFILMGLIVFFEGRLYLGFTIICWLGLSISTNSAFILGYFVQAAPTLSDQATPKSIVVNAWGGISFGLGIILAILLLRKRSGRPQEISPLLQNQGALISLFLIGEISAYLLPLAVHRPTVGAVQSQLEWLSLIALFCWLYGCKWNRWLIMMMAFWVLMCLVQISRTGFLGNLFYSIQLVLIGVFGRKLSWRRICGVSAFVGFFLVLILYWFQVRSFIRQGGLSADSGTDNKVVGLVEAVKERPLWKIDYKKSLYDIWVGRVDASLYYSNEQDWVPSHESYAGWSTVFPAVFASLVPRAVWPDKSIVQGGTEYVNRFTGWDFDPQSIQFNLPFPFEFYAMFGVRGLATGMFLLGFTIAYLERLICLRRIPTVGVMVTLAVLETLYTGGDQIRTRVTVLGAAVGLYLILGIFLEWVFQDQTPAKQIIKPSYS